MMLALVVIVAIAVGACILLGQHRRGDFEDRQDARRARAERQIDELKPVDYDRRWR